MQFVCSLLTFIDSHLGYSGVLFVHTRAQIHIYQIYTNFYSNLAKNFKNSVFLATFASSLLKNYASSFEQDQKEFLTMAKY
jgi:hypothetical protein